MNLSPWGKGPATGRGAMFAATIRWEFRVVPDDPIMRISCVSDPDEYRELTHDPSSIDAWYFRPAAKLTGASPKAFEVLQFTLDGRQLPVHRTTTANSQTFTIDLGPEVVAQRRKVTISYTHRILVQRDGHLLHLDLSRPAKGLNVQLSYGGCGIRYVNVLDYIAGAHQPRLTQILPPDPTPSVEVSYDGWVFPKGGVAFVWVLDSESPASTV